MRTITILLLSCASLLAEDFYIAQTALGTGTGTSAANALAYTFFNTSGNWDTVVNTTNGKIGPGDTVHITGIITQPLTFQGSGTPGNRITLKFEPGGQLRHPTSTGTGMVAGTGIHDVTVEGGNPGPVQTSLTQMDIYITDNGTDSANQVASTTALTFENAGSNITIKNLFVWGLYVRRFANNFDFRESRTALQVKGNDDIVIENCAVQHAEGGISTTGVSTLNERHIIRNNLVLDCSTAIKHGATSPNVNLNCRITGNRLDGFDRYSGIGPTPDVHFHCDGIQTITATADQEQRYLTVAYNHIGPNIGTDGTMNAHIFLEDLNNGANVYNNICETKAGAYTINMMITAQTHPDFVGRPTYRKTLVANNTLVHHGGGNPRWAGAGIACLHAIVTGNIVLNQRYVTADNSATFNDNIIDYNLYFGTDPSDAPFGVRGTQGPGIYSIGNWLNLTPYDDHSLPPFVTDPKFVSTIAPVDLHLQSTSPAIGLAQTSFGGVDLTAIFTDDFYGNPRTVPWDAGAVEFTAGGPTLPVALSSAINPAGNQVSVTFNEAVTFGAGGNGGLSLSSSFGALTLGTPSVAGATITWPVTNRLIGSGEVITRTYAQPGNGIESTTSQLDLSSFTGIAVTNSSTVAQAVIPVFAPVPGAYSGTQNVAITSTTSGTPGFSIRYTTNGTDPTTTNGTVYSGPIPTSLTTTYKARAFATGFLDSPIATGAYQIGDFAIGNAWTNIGVANQTGTFTWTFRATSTTSPNDAVLGLTNKTVAAYADLGVIARFAASGRIDAWNDGPVTKDYAAVNPFPYVAGQAYDFVVTVNIPTHTYSMTVVQAGGSSPTVIATNYGFRGVQATATNLNNFGAIATGGGVTVSNMVFTGAAPTLSLTGIATNPAGTQITASFNSQPSFGLGGQGGFTVSASAGATTPSAPTVGTNSITWNLSRTIGRGETISATYVQPGNGIEAASGGADLASFAGQSAANNSTVDTTAPIPNPSTFGIAPTALTSSTITMTATTSTDAATPPVQYFFNEVSGNAGGSDSGWQSSATFTDAGLAAGTQYRYRVQTRDSAVPPNVTTFSTEFSATTKSVAGARPAQPFNMARANIVTP